MMKLGLATAGAVVILDQASKTAVLAHFAGSPDADTVTPFFNLVLTFNRGMSFGLFNTGSRSAVNAWLFSLAAAIIVIGLVLWLRRVTSPLLGLAIGLVVGGALGNVIDRIRYCAVVDFLDFHIANYHWPAFNLADSAICLGVVAMLLESLLIRREAH